MTLALLARQVPPPVRAAFLAGLRARGIAEPSDRAVAPALPRAWSAPGIYAAVFTEHVLPVLGEPERAAAQAALDALAATGPASAKPPRMSR